MLSKIPENPYFIASVRGPLLHSKIPEEESEISTFGMNFPIISLTVVSGEKMNKKLSFLFSKGVKYDENHLAT